MLSKLSDKIAKTYYYIDTVLENHEFSNLLYYSEKEFSLMTAVETYVGFFVMLLASSTSINQEHFDILKTIAPTKFNTLEELRDFIQTSSSIIQESCAEYNPDASIFKFAVEIDNIVELSEDSDEIKISSCIFDVLCDIGILCISASNEDSIVKTFKSLTNRIKAYLSQYNIDVTIPLFSSPSSKTGAEEYNEFKEYLEQLFQMCDSFDEMLLSNNDKPLRNMFAKDLRDIIIYALREIDDKEPFKKILSEILPASSIVCDNVITEPDIPAFFKAYYECSLQNSNIDFNPSSMYEILKYFCKFFLDEFTARKIDFKHHVFFAQYLNKVADYCEERGGIVQNRPTYIDTKYNNEVTSSYFVNGLDYYKNFEYGDRRDDNVLYMWNYFSQNNNSDIKIKNCINIISLLGLAAGTLNYIGQDSGNEKVIEKFFTPNYSIINSYKRKDYAGDIIYDVKQAICTKFPKVGESFKYKEEIASQIIGNIMEIDFSLGMEIFRWVVENFAKELKRMEYNEYFIDNALHCIDRDKMEDFFKEINEDERFLLGIFEFNYRWSYGTKGLLQFLLKKGDYITVENAFKIYVDSIDTKRQELDELLKGLIDSSTYNENSKYQFSMNKQAYELFLKYANEIPQELNRRAVLTSLEDKYKRYCEFTNYQNNIAPKEVKVGKKQLFNPDVDKDFDFSRLKEKTVNERKENPIWEDGKFLDFTSVVGFTFRPKEDREKILKTMRKGDKWILEREPENEHDALAIKVLDKNRIKVGYIPKTGNTILSTLMDSGQNLFARLNAFGTKGSNIEIAIEIFLGI